MLYALLSIFMPVEDGWVAENDQCILVLTKTGGIFRWWKMSDPWEICQYCNLPMSPTGAPEADISPGLQCLSLGGCPF